LKQVYGYGIDKRLLCSIELLTLYPGFRHAFTKPQLLLFGQPQSANDSTNVRCSEN